ncbi:hypothetical protein [Ornithinimicrobium sp. CNJ-824]|uniref:hypothetical protein n=1 Tax=Ornithinimicrobium sp. CNJ-824 TaxID=1904966 RepID=UPI00117EAC63|nr:hypothetical protein [Ornithinimicrobium sp. CNJ-824]
MTHDEGRTADHDPTHEEDQLGDDQGDGSGEGTVSEAGSAAVNPDTSLGGADSVPDTPDATPATTSMSRRRSPGRRAEPPRRARRQECPRSSRRCASYTP